MKKIRWGISSVLLVSFCLSISSPSFGIQPPQAAKFSNCTELNKVYPGGVAKNSKVTNKGGETKNPPTVKPSVYKKNASKDRDRDGIACEK
jgi:hypothetical protein